MKNILLSASMLAVSAGGTLAGGIDRSGQGIDILFEDGGYLELSLGLVMPDVSGSLGGGASLSGNMADDYSQFGTGIKNDLSEKLSFAVIWDQPFGANVVYPSGTGYLFAGSTATITSNAITALARYKITDRFSVIGGMRHQSLTGEAFVSIFAPWSLDVSDSSGFGYVAGAAFEIPDIALFLTSH